MRPAENLVAYTIRREHLARLSMRLLDLPEKTQRILFEEAEQECRLLLGDLPKWEMRLSTVETLLLQLKLALIRRTP